ncbi:MAG TPA: hypothetical protein VGB15_18555 [Longimicrobium sp.]|jgi:hypothetical protein
MKKIKLDLDELGVESFNIGAADGDGGTVEGRVTTYTEAPNLSCPRTGCYSYPAFSCPSQCPARCDGEYWTEDPNDCYVNTSLETCDPCG